MTSRTARSEVGTESSRWSWVRPVGVLLVGLVVGLPALAAYLFLYVLGARFGWVAGLGALGVYGAAVAWLAVSSRRPAARRNLAMGLATVLGSAGVVLAHWAPATAGRLRQEIQRLEQPAWQLVDEHVDGSPTCFDYCLSVAREYVVDLSAADLSAEMAPRLVSRGFTERSLSGPDLRYFDSRRGEIDVTVRIEPDDSGSAVRVSATT